MAEKKYEIPENPQYSEDIRELQDSDPASASGVFNPLFRRIIENVAAVKRWVDKAVPNTRKVNNKALSSDISLAAEDVGAAPAKLAFPVEGEILETLCEKVMLDDNNKSYTFPEEKELSLEDPNTDFYLLDYRYYKDNILDQLDSSVCIGNLVNGQINFLTDNQENQVRVSSTKITDTWRGAAAKSVVSLYKIRYTASSRIQRATFQRGNTNNNAAGHNAFTVGKNNLAAGMYSSALGVGNVVSEHSGAALGHGNKVTGQCASALGINNEVSRHSAIALGNGNKVAGPYAVAEGKETYAYGEGSHSEGRGTVAFNNYDHAEGQLCITGDHYNVLKVLSWDVNSRKITFDPSFHYLNNAFSNVTVGTQLLFTYNATSLGGLFKGTVESKDSTDYSIIIKESFAQYVSFQFAIRIYDYSGGAPECKRVEGKQTVATGWYSSACGYGTVASGQTQRVIGRYNKWTDITNSAEYTTNKFIIGKGDSDSSRANCFRVTDTGVYATGAHNTTGADYAELFEWADGNPNSEDRVGRFVALDGDKISLAGLDSGFILGIITGNPSVVGDVHDDQWQGMYLYDIFGRPVWEDVEVPDETMEMPDPEDPEKIITQVVVPAHTVHRQKLNPEYDSSQKYIPRTERPEWGCVGLMGKLVVVDDGSCRVNGWCAPGEGAIAVASDIETKFRVMERLDDTHVRVLIL